MKKFGFVLGLFLLFPLITHALTGSTTTRDAQRLADMATIQNALESYKTAHGQYPNPDSEAGCWGWDTSSVGGFLSALQLPSMGFTAFTTPLDPVNDGRCSDTVGVSGYHYRYYRYPAGAYGADPTKGAYYVLGFSKLEASTGNSPASPGFSTKDRGWQVEFAWVTGRYENQGSLVTIKQAAITPTSQVAGQPISITYNWSGGPTTLPQHVFVHFVNAITPGNIVFQDDHFSPTPTNQWTGNISYTRNVTIPSGTPAGVYKVMVGLFDEGPGSGGTWERSTLRAGPGVVVDGELRYEVGRITVGTTGGGTSAQRDAQRIADMATIQTALENYKTAHGQYPNPDSEVGCGGWDTSSIDGFISVLQPTAPRDPVNNGRCEAIGTSGYFYRYYRYSPGSYGADITKGSYYVLGFDELEATTGNSPASPGFSTTQRNWQNEFAWVVGRYETSGSITGPVGYTYCANENQQCNFSGTRQVAYGANNTFVYRTFTSSALCANSIFGDPVQGVVKECFYAPTTIVLPAGPRINSISPTTGQVGSTVTITGTGFSATNNTIMFNSSATGLHVLTSLATSNGTSMTFTVPSSISATCIVSGSCYSSAVTPGTYYVNVWDSSKSIAENGANARSFTVTSGTVRTPTIDYSLPKPTNLSVTCPAPGTKAIVTWTAPYGYGTFYTRASKGLNNFGGQPFVAEAWQENFVGTSFTFPTTAGEGYTVWIHTKNIANGDYSEDVRTNVTCAGTSGIVPPPNPLPPPPPPGGGYGGGSTVLINSGGGSYTDGQGRGWVADGYVSGGSTANTNNNIANTNDQTLYKDSRWGNFTYTVSGLTAGSSYNVILKFAETNFSSAGQRKFNVSINGSTVLSNFDIVQEAGVAFKALDKPFTATANAGGQVTIQFTQGSADLPMVSAVEVSSRGSATKAHGTSGLAAVISAVLEFLGLR